MNAPRIGYLLKKFPRLSETFILNELLGQERLGTSLHVFSRRTPDDEPRHPELAKLKAPVEVLPSTSQLDPWRELFVESGGDPVLLERIGACVREMQRFDLPRLPRILAEAVHLARRTRELSIDHVHVHFATESALAAMLLNDIGGPTYSVTAHAKDIYRSTVDPRLLSRVVRQSAFTVTVCDANVDHLRGMLDADAAPNVRRLYNGIDLELFSVSQERRDESHVLGVGRLVEKKGFDVFIRAIGELRARGRAVRGSIVGEGDERPRLEALIREHDLAGTIELLGPLDQNAVRELMERATVFCLPCRIGTDGNRDALPTVLLEALATGTPCVSTPVTGVPEILAEGYAGPLVPCDDVQATADAIDSLLQSAEARDGFSRIGRRRAEELFDSRAAAASLRSWFLEAAQACASQV